jgi:hypothetical protein
VEGNKTDFSIVAPKIDHNEFMGNNSALEILDPIRDQDSKAQRSLFIKKGGQIGPSANEKPMCANCRHFEKEFYNSES